MHENSKKETPQKKLTEKLQQMGKKTAVPEDLKEEVFSTLDTLNLFADIADLFTAKFTMTELEAFGMTTESTEPIKEVNQSDLKNEIKNKLTPKQVNKDKRS